MDNRQKLELINTLAARIGWLIRAYSKREEVDNWDIVRAELAYVHFEDEESSEGGPFAFYQGAHRPSGLDGFNRTMEGLIESNLAFVRLDYSFIERKLVLDIDCSRLTSEAAGYFEAPERLLEFFDEADIRRAFADHEAVFLKQTQTTADDWFLAEIRCEG